MTVAFLDGLDGLHFRNVHFQKPLDPHLQGHLGHGAAAAGPFEPDLDDAILADLTALQQLPAVQFIETRDTVQAQAQEYITGYLTGYQVETRGVYVQDVTFPPELVAVLTQREIANQERVTFEEQKRAQEVRVDLERVRGTADMQTDLAKASVNVDIQKRIRLLD